MRRRASRMVCRLTSYSSVRLSSPGKPVVNSSASIRRRRSVQTWDQSGMGLERSGWRGPTRAVVRGRRILAGGDGCGIPRSEPNVRTSVQQVQSDSPFRSGGASTRNRSERSERHTVCASSADRREMREVSNRVRIGSAVAMRLACSRAYSRLPSGVSIDVEATETAQRIPVAHHHPSTGAIRDGPNQPRAPPLPNV